MKVINIEKLFEAQKLLEEVYIIDKDGETQQIKYFNFETFTLKQSKHKKINKNIITSTRINKYDKDFFSIKGFIIVEKEMEISSQKEINKIKP